MNRELLAYKINFKFYSFLAFFQTFNDVKTTLVIQLTQSFHANEVIFVNFKFAMTDNNLLKGPKEKKSARTLDFGLIKIMTQLFPLHVNFNLTLRWT